MSSRLLWAAFFGSAFLYACSQPVNIIARGEALIIPKIIQKEIIAQEKLSFPISENGQVRKNLKLISSAPLPTEYFSFSGSQMILDWQTDFQDIGFHKGQMVFEDQPRSYPMDFEIKVLPPKVETHSCFYAPPPIIDTIAPSELWHWSGYEYTYDVSHPENAFPGAVSADSDKDGKVFYSVTYSSPVAADLDNDGKVEVVTIPSASKTDYTGPSYMYYNSPLVVLQGSTGAVLMNSFDVTQHNGPAFGVMPSQTPALIDLNKNGNGKIIATARGPAWSASSYIQNNVILIIDYKSKSVEKTFSHPDFICGNNCMASVGDIDADGETEIAAGNVILNSNGNVKHWLLPAPALGISRSTVSMVKLVADETEIRGKKVSGLQLLVGGAQVYSNQGELLWDSGCRGYSAAADLLQDPLHPAMNVVCIGATQVNVYDVQGNVLGQQMIPYNPNCSLNPTGTTPEKCIFNSSGGPPNIGNFLGNGRLQIGTAGGDYYLVYEYDGTAFREIWKKETYDRSSSSTGSTLFSLNGDGTVQVFYNDESELRIYDGKTGDVIWHTPNRSGTLWEYPLIVDINNDGSADIVTSSPGYPPFSETTFGGVRVFTTTTKNWVATRNLWNQYSYYPELVDDKLQAVKEPGFPKIGFRVNTPGSKDRGGNRLLPQFQVRAPFFPDYEPVGTESDRRTLSFFISNQGESRGTNSGYIQLNLYEAGSSRLIATEPLAHDLPPDAGAWQLIHLKIKDEALKTDLPYRITINQDAAGNELIRQCDKISNSSVFSLRGLSR